MSDLGNFLQGANQGIVQGLNNAGVIQNLMQNKAIMERENKLAPFREQILKNQGIVSGIQASEAQTEQTRLNSSWNTNDMLSKFSNPEQLQIVKTRLEDFNPTGKILTQRDKVRFFNEMKQEPEIIDLVSQPIKTAVTKDYIATLTNYNAAIKSGNPEAIKAAAQNVAVAQAKKEKTFMETGHLESVARMNRAWVNMPETRKKQYPQLQAAVDAENPELYKQIELEITKGEMKPPPETWGPEIIKPGGIVEQTSSRGRKSHWQPRADKTESPEKYTMMQRIDDTRQYYAAKERAMIDPWGGVMPQYKKQYQNLVTDMENDIRAIRNGRKASWEEEFPHPPPEQSKKLYQNYLP